MAVNKVEFISSHGRGFNTDLKIIKEYLFNNVDDIKFDFFIGKDNAKNPFYAKGVRKARAEFNKSVSNVICMDGSLPAKLNKNFDNTNRILFSVPFDYQFKIGYYLIKNGKFNEKKTFKNFTHIFPGSKFGEELLNQVFVNDAKIIKDVELPFNWLVDYGNKKEYFKTKFEYYFPKMKGKKVISIVTNSLKSTNDIKLKCDLKEFLDRISDDWFVLTNNYSLFNQASQLDEKYTEKFGYVNIFIPLQWVMCFTDCLLTNVGRYATVFASTGNPVYCLNFMKNYFEKYVKSIYPTMFINSLDDFNKEYLDNHDEIEDIKKFVDMFSYNSPVSPGKKLVEIINE